MNGASTPKLTAARTRAHIEGQLRRLPPNRGLTVDRPTLELAYPSQGSSLVARTAARLVGRKPMTTDEQLREVAERFGCLVMAEPPHAGGGVTLLKARAEERGVPGDPDGMAGGFWG